MNQPEILQDQNLAALNEPVWYSPGQENVQSQSNQNETPSLKQL